MQNQQALFCDALVLGSGLAGFNFAIEFAQLNPDQTVLIVTKAEQIWEGATAYAQGGIAAVLSDDDSTDLHVQDTLKTGGGLSHTEIVKLCIEDGPARVRDLIERGVPFTRGEGNSQDYDFNREGGHSRRRILHVADTTGRAIIDALILTAKKLPNIKILTQTIGVDLVTDHKLQHKRTNRGATCLGAYLMDIRSKQVFSVTARVTMLATGGAGKVYKYTSNPDTNNGDGIAMAYRAGCAVANMEFIQFHPTCLYHPLAKSHLLSEAMRGEGALLKNKAGERFMEKYSPERELAPRDIVAFSIDKEMKRTGDNCVYLDISHRGLDFIKTHFPHNYEVCLQYGYDLSKEPVPVVPAAHYTCGGVRSDADGATSINGLYVAGEVAHTGLHGANRLASNSLLEAAVFSYRAAHAASIYYRSSTTKGPLPIPAWNPGFAKVEEEEVIIAHNWDEIRTLMWNYVGIVRSNRRLEYAQRRISVLKQEINQCYWERKLNRNLIELRNLVTVADFIVSSAMQRKESRGLHQNIDYPETNDKDFHHDTVL